jgi:hypothetical protein
VQKQIEEANRLGSEAKKRAKERAKELKEERKRVKVETKEKAKELKELKEEKKVALALAALEVPTSKGVVWHTHRACWKVQLSAHGKQWYLGCFDFDDHTEAVALYKRHKSKTKTELEALA